MVMDNFGTVQYVDSKHIYARINDLMDSRNHARMEFDYKKWYWINRTLVTSELSGAIADKAYSRIMYILNICHILLYKTGVQKDDIDEMALWLEDAELLINEAIDEKGMRFYKRFNNPAEAIIQYD